MEVQVRVNGWNEVCVIVRGKLKGAVQEEEMDTT